MKLRGKYKTSVQIIRICEVGHINQGPMNREEKKNSSQGKWRTAFVRDAVFETVENSSTGVWGGRKSEPSGPCWSVRRSGKGKGSACWWPRSGAEVQVSSESQG